MKIESSQLQLNSPMKWNGDTYTSIPRITIKDREDEIEILQLPGIHQGNFNEILQRLKKDLLEKKIPKTYKEFREILKDYPSHIYYSLDLYYRTLEFSHKKMNHFPFERCHQLITINNLLNAEILGSVIKLKLGRLSFDEEIQIIEEFLKNNSQVLLRIDTNSSYTQKQYHFLISKFDKNIDYIELETSELSYKLNCKIAWDYNSCNSIPNVDIIVLKPSLVGDIDQIKDFLTNTKKEIVFSSTFESQAYQQYILENVASLNQIHGLLSFQYRD